MPRFAANLTMLFTEVPFLDRFERAARAGFEAVEFLFPYAYSVQDIRQRLVDNGLQLVLHNLPAGDWDAGERGIACHPDRQAEFREGVVRAIGYAQALGVGQLNCLAGKAPAGVPEATLRATFVDNLRHAAAALKPAGLKLLIEPINSYDIPGFYLNRTQQAADILAEVGADNAFIQYDIYHAQRMEGELAATMQKHLPRIGHIQLADNPGRNEPGTGEIHYPFLFAHLDRIGYTGWIGCETSPPPAPKPASAGASAWRSDAPAAPRHQHQGIQMTTSALKIGFVGLGIMGTPHGRPPHAGRAPALRPHPGQDAGGHRQQQRHAMPERPCRRRACRHHHRHGARHARRRSRAVCRQRHRRRLSRGKVVVDMSSISPIATKVFAQKINALGCDYLDAPVSGGEVGAKNATLSIMVGGSEATFARVKPLFELMGKNITLVGGNGDGQTAKVANQIIVALNIEAVAEALLFAAKAGADPARVRQALMGGFASSKILEVHGERMVKRTFDPGFRIELHQKDLNLALSSARALGVSLPNTATAQELFNSCVAHGGKAWDHSAMVKALEKLANFEIGQQAG